MPPVPKLLVVALERVLPHEEVDPLRVDGLAARIEADGLQVNPVACVEGGGGQFVLLDGATRTAALRRLGLGFAVAQVVRPDTITLETWHHVIRGTEPEAVIRQIQSDGDLTVAEGTETPLISTAVGEPQTVHGEGLSQSASLSSLVSSYIGRWRVNRVIDTDLNSVAQRFPDWAAVVEFPRLSIDDVMKAALEEDRLPAGVTRFVFPDRALRVNTGLGLLRYPGEEADKQVQLDRLLEERAQAGRVRHYPQSVVIYDE